MAVDKLVDSTQLDADLTTVANAIRAKGGTSAQLSFPSGMAQAVGNLSSLDKETSTAMERTVPSNAQNHAEIASFGGASMKWNQLAPSSLTITNNTSGSFTAGAKIVAGHKYYFSSNVSGHTASVAVNVFARVNGANCICFYLVATSSVSSCEGIKTADYGGTSTGSITVTEGNVWLYTYHNDGNNGYHVDNIRLVDLTALYGAGNEPSSLDDPKITAIKAYIEKNPSYFAGGILNAIVTSIVSKDSENTVLSTLSIPSAVQSLPSYGVGMLDGSAYNYVDWESKKFHQVCKIGTGKNIVNQADIASDQTSRFYIEDGAIKATDTTADNRTWAYNYCQNYFRLEAGTYTISVVCVTPTANNVSSARIYKSGASSYVLNFKPLYNATPGSVMSRTFTVAEEADYGFMCKVFEGAYKLQIEKGSTATAYEDYEQTVVMLSEPIETDISSLISPYNALKVSAWGTITFENSANLNVPATIGYYKNIFVPGKNQEGITPTGTISITENGTYDVTNYASADVQVSGGSSGFKIYLYHKINANDGGMIKINDSIVYKLSDTMPDATSYYFMSSSWANNLDSVETFKLWGFDHISTYPNTSSSWARYRPHSGGAWTNITLKKAEAEAQTITLTEDIDLEVLEATCLNKGTLISMADGTKKKIEDIIVGDVVKTYSGTGVVYKDEHNNRAFGDERDIWNFDNGYQIITTYRHEFYNFEQGKMTYLDEWNIGEHAITEDGSKVKLIEHIHEDVPCKYYSLWCDGGNNYYANCLLAGNRFTEFDEPPEPIEEVENE